MASRLVAEAATSKRKHEMACEYQRDAANYKRRLSLDKPAVIRRYCGVKVIVSNVRLYPELAGFFPTTVNVKK
jgi:hypothetical protein